MTTIDEKALLPCPFCGQSLFYSHAHFTWQHPHWPCPARYLTPFRSDEGDAITAWNRRALSAPSSREAPTGWHQGVEAAADALQDNWTRDMSMPDVLQVLNNLATCYAPETVAVERGAEAMWRSEVADMPAASRARSSQLWADQASGLRERWRKLAQIALNAALTSPVKPANEEGWSEAAIERVVQAVRPWTMRTLFLEEHRKLVRDALAAPTPSDPYTEAQLLRKEADAIGAKADAKLREAYDKDSAADDIGREERP